MSTLTEKLRRGATQHEYWPGGAAVMAEAADRIEALEAELREVNDRVETAVTVLREKPGYTVKSIADALAVLSRSGNGEGT